MEWFKGRRTVAPIDFSDESQKAVDAALEMLGPEGELHVLHVAPDLAVLEPGMMWGDVTDESRRDNLKASFRERFAAPKYASVELEVRFGDPGHGIARYAEEIGAGLIVMPSHGRTGLSHVVLGSVAERVVRYAHCPVLVLRS